MRTESFGRASVSDYLGERIVYRNLAPLDPQLPALSDLREMFSLPPHDVPRKSEPDYARTIVKILERAQEIEHPGSPLKRLIYVGDTRLNDGRAFGNLCRASGWAGRAFICSENRDPPSVEIERLDDASALNFANRWGALSGTFENIPGFPIDEHTAVVIDLDKTAIGARGRNDQVIDQARADAIRMTARKLLGQDFNDSAFQNAYSQLNQVEFHAFTFDNQDYLAYICLIVSGGYRDLDRLISEVRSGKLVSFEQFISQVDQKESLLPEALNHLHGDVFAKVQAGDPTPFKEFRRNEYLKTVERMGFLSDSAPAGRMLSEEIVITREVLEFALECQAEGALLFGLSDKPDEASLPDGEQVAAGYLPIHRTPAHVVGMLD